MRLHKDSTDLQNSTNIEHEQYVCVRVCVHAVYIPCDRQPKQIIWVRSVVHSMSVFVYEREIKCQKRCATTSCIDECRWIYEFSHKSRVFMYNFGISYLHLAAWAFQFQKPRSTLLQEAFPQRYTQQKILVQAFICLPQNSHNNISSLQPHFHAYTCIVSSIFIQT